VNIHLQSFSLSAVVALAGMSAVAPAQGTPDQAAAVSSDQPISLDIAAGHALALHFLPATDAPQATAFIREYAAASDTVAGVRHAFIKRGDPAHGKAWADSLGEHARLVYTDAGGVRSSAHSVAGDNPVTIILGPGGKELARIAGNSPADFAPFKSFAGTLTSATKSPALKDYNLPRQGVPAVEGYDVVAYFTQSKAVKGDAKLASNYQGVTYQFSSTESRRLFAQNPERYLPTYGGWCATAMGDTGTKVEIDPKNFKVEHCRLFLFYKDFFSDASKDWAKHRVKWEPAADGNWQKLTGEAPVVPAK
jgi:YHS domain-containing protein